MIATNIEDWKAFFIANEKLSYALYDALPDTSAQQQRKRQTRNIQSVSAGFRGPLTTFGIERVVSGTPNHAPGSASLLPLEWLRKTFLAYSSVPYGGRDSLTDGSSVRREMDTLDCYWSNFQQVHWTMIATKNFRRYFRGNESGGNELMLCMILG